MSIAGVGRALVAVFAAATLVAPSAQAAESVESKVQEATKILEERQASSRPIPESVLRDARCIATLKVFKVGLVVGGQGSSGLVSCRTADGSWSAPSFFGAGGANLGLQAGVQSAQTVLVFTSDDAREALLSKSSFKLGADASYALGPVGEGSGAGPTAGAAVLSYQETEGFYAGLTFEGVVLTPSTERNEAAYGPGATPRKILTMSGESAPAVTRPFVTALSKAAPAKAETSS